MHGSIYKVEPAVSPQRVLGLFVIIRIYPYFYILINETESKLKGKET